MRAASLTLLIIVAAGCSDAKDSGQPSSTAPAASAPRSAAAPAGTTSTATTASASPSSTAAAPAAFEATPEPELKEWATSKIVKVPGSDTNSCETRMVREWLRVMCVNRNAELGKPAAIKVERGRAPNERSKGENLKAVNDITTLVMPVRPGTDFVAAFSWENGSHSLSVRWPDGTPEAQRVMEFDNAGAPDGAATAGGDAPLGPGPVAAGTTSPSEAPLDDVASLAAVPDDAAWEKTPEARVKGSTAAGCETKLSGDWFRARCKAADTTKAITTILPIKGHRKTQTTVKIEDGVATLITPYVEGTEMHARFSTGSSSTFLVLRWPKGPKPETIGAFESGK
ncbi:MAG: hypothetical protein HOV80_11610 [Polyangiaceae bacterium]|nr:hypothetical protein [Polyangiaceae bacterium]